MSRNKQEILAAVKRIETTSSKEEAQELLGDAMNVAVNVIGAFALMAEQNDDPVHEDFFDDLGTVVADGARNYLVLNR